MTREADDAIDMRLREHGARWATACPPPPDVDEALRRAQARPPILTRGLVVAVVAVVVLVVSIGTILLTRHHPADRTNARRPASVPSATIAKLAHYAHATATSNGDTHATAEGVQSTYRPAERLMSPNDVTSNPASARVWVIQLRGHFVCHTCSFPHGASEPTGTVITAILIEPDLRVTDFAITRHAFDLSQLGPVIQLP